MREGSTRGQIAAETSQGTPHDSRPAQNDVSLVRTWLALDGLFGSLQAGFGSLHMVDEEQDRSVDNTEGRTGLQQWFRQCLQPTQHGMHLAGKHHGLGKGNLFD